MIRVEVTDDIVMTWNYPYWAWMIHENSCTLNVCEFVHACVVWSVVNAYQMLVHDPIGLGFVKIWKTGEKLTFSKGVIGYTLCVIDYHP